MITKTLSGIPLLDDTYGGVFSNRSFLVTGAKGAGKTVMGLQFILEGLEQDDRCVYLSTMVADDLGILAESLGFKLSSYVTSEALTLLEYESFMSGSGSPGLDMLPPEGFEQLRSIIHANSIERVVLDTVLPWVSVRDPERMPQQVFSFTRSLDRLGVTTMLTLPKPVSTLAFRLKKSIEEVVPISILLQPSEGSEPSTFQVTKYLGEKKLGGKSPFKIQEEIGITEITSQDPHTPRSATPPRTAAKPREKQRPKFSAVPFDRLPEKRPAPVHDTAPEERTTQASVEQPQHSKNSFVRQDPPENASYHPQTAAQEASPSQKENEEKTSGAMLSAVWKPQTEKGIQEDTSR